MEKKMSITNLKTLVRKKNSKIQRSNTNMIEDINLVIVFPSFVFSFLLYKWLRFGKVVRKHLPPSPPKLPILGNLHQLGKYPHRTLNSLSDQYGELMLLHLGTKLTLVVSSANAAEQITKTNDIIFSNRPQSKISKRLIYNRKNITGAPYGEYWRQMKSVCVLHLLSSQRVRSFRKVREEEARLTMDTIRKSSSAVNLSEMFMTFTSNVICRVALGRKYSKEENGAKMLKELVEVLGTFSVGNYVPWLAWIDRINGLDAKVNKIATKLDQFLEGVIKEHMEQRTREENGDMSAKEARVKDFVDVLLDLQTDSSAGFYIETDSIKAILVDMFAGGTDTTYTVLEWAMTELLRHPAVMEKLQHEVRDITNGQKDVTEEGLHQMSYLKAVIKETLRLHPPIPLLVPRESTQDVKINGYDIAAGTQVITNAWAIHRDPASWEDPEEFRPERFLNSSVDYKGNHFQLIPFGSGRRSCPGIFFALANNELVLANLMYKFDWSLPRGETGETLDMSQRIGLTIHRKEALLAVATPCS